MAASRNLPAPSNSQNATINTVKVMFTGFHVAMIIASLYFLPALGEFIERVRGDRAAETSSKNDMQFPPKPQTAR
jgi:hypothetical protein